jgi:hypothetical protein
VTGQGGAVGSTRIDRIARTLARLDSRRGFFAAVAGAALAATGREAATAQVEAEAVFDGDCRKFILAPSRDRRRKFNNVDDNLLVEVIEKGRRGKTRTVWDDTDDNNVNFRGEPFRIPPFKARVGDRLRIQAFNLGGSCELDELWLFCKGDSRGIRLDDGVRKDESCAEGRFFDETFRIGRRP